MRRRKPQRNAGALGLPLHEAIGEFAFAGNLGRPDVAPVLEYCTECDRHRRDLQARAPLAHLRQLQIRKRRNEVEIPGRLHGGRSRRKADNRKIHHEGTKNTKKSKKDFDTEQQ
jgi:hypothetical protein